MFLFFNAGKNSFMWVGPISRVNVMNPEYLKDIYAKYDIFLKPDTNQRIKALVTGVVMHNGEKWEKHRKIINPAFHLEKLKVPYLTSSNLI